VRGTGWRALKILSLVSSIMGAQKNAITQIIKAKLRVSAIPVGQESDLVRSHFDEVQVQLSSTSTRVSMPMTRVFSCHSIFNQWTTDKSKVH
jgi:hypothetical protein